MDTSVPEVPDAEYVARARRGGNDERKHAFAALVGRHETHVRNLVRHLTREVARADEIAQDAFFIAWQKLGTLKNPDGFGAWVRRIAYREFLHVVRRDKLEAAYLASHVDQPETAELYDDTELQRWLSVCSPIEREIMLLQYGYGFTLDEISADREIPLGTIKSHVHRAKSKIKDLLVKDGALHQEKDQKEDQEYG